MTTPFTQDDIDLLDLLLDATHSDHHPAIHALSGKVQQWLDQQDVDDAWRRLKAAGADPFTGKGFVELGNGLPVLDETDLTEG